MLAGVVATAELLAVVARLDIPVECDPRGDIHSAGTAVLTAGAVFGAVLLTGRLPAPTGLAAVILAAAACALLAALLANGRNHDG